MAAVASNAAENGWCGERLGESQNEHVVRADFAMCWFGLRTSGVDEILRCAQDDVKGGPCEFALEIQYE
jgi:hypothetical protein